MSSASSRGVDRIKFDFASKYPKGLELSKDVVSLMEEKRKAKTAIAFDEITLEDKPSDYHPSDVNLLSFVTRKIALKGCGIISAAMDTVTEAELALAIAKVGGMGILHRNLDAETQASMVTWVRKKINYGGMILKPITFKPDQRYSQVQAEIKNKGWTFTSFPIVDASGKLLGLLTRDEMDFVEGTNPLLQDIMKPRNLTITCTEGTDTEKAYQIMKDRKVKKLPVVKNDDTLLGMYIWSDVKQDKRKKEYFSLDDEGHFLVGAAIGLGQDEMHRINLLVESKCKVLVLDSSHGACKPAKEQIQRIREKYGETVEIIAGNIASYESAMYLLDSKYKPDSLKVGIGPGSICTTRTVTGHGIPQVTALYEVWRAVKDHGDKTGYYVPIIADGGIRSSGDVVKCLAVGASACMLGSIFAGTEESPGKVITDGGKRYKVIRGMGSRSAMAERSGSRLRYYRQEENKHASEELTNEQKTKMVPEGVEGLVEFRGSVESVVFEFIGGIQSGLAHTGACDIKQFQEKATFWCQSFAGVAEGNPHNITNIRV
jgi:IMP dehydrogenase